MQELKVIHSEFIGLVDIIAVDITPTVSLDELVNFGETQDYPWLMGRTSRDTLQDLEVFTQSTKIGIEADGTLAYREIMGSGNVSVWREAFTQLSQQG